MEELKLTLLDWHLLSNAYCAWVDAQPDDVNDETRRHREALADQIAAFSVQVREMQKPIIVRIEE